MSELMEATGWFFSWLWRASWQTSIVVLLVLGAQSVLGQRLAPRWRHALWLFVIIRSALPWSFESPASVFNCPGARPIVMRASSGREPGLALSDEPAGEPGTGAARGGRYADGAVAVAVVGRCREPDGLPHGDQLATGPAHPQAAARDG